MTAWSIIETVAGWWQWFLPRLGWWFLGSCASALLWWVTAPMRRQEPRVLDKELAPPGADVLRLNGFRGGMKVLALVAVCHLLACDVVVNKAEGVEVFRATVPRWVGLVTIGFSIGYLGHKLYVRLTRGRR